MTAQTKNAPTKNAPTRTAPGPTRRGGRSAGPTRQGSAAVQRAYDRRRQRTRRANGERIERAAGGRGSYVVLTMVLLCTALAAILWLSTAAAAGSYRLEKAEERTRDLSEYSEVLRREVANLETTPELARRAAGLGLVSAGNPARLLVNPDGTVTVVGEPRRARAPAPPPPPPSVVQPAPAPVADPAAPPVDPAAPPDPGALAAAPVAEATTPAPPSDPAAPPPAPLPDPPVPVPSQAPPVDQVAPAGGR